MKVLIQMGDPYFINNPCTKRIRAFQNELISQGHEVFVLAPCEKGIPKADGVTYCPTVPLKKKTTVYRLLNSLCFAVTSVVRSARFKQIDVVLTTCPPPLINMAGWLIAKCKRAKLIYDVRDIWPDIALEMGSFDRKSIYYKTFRFIRDFMLKHSDLTTAVSPGKVKKLKGYAPNKKIVNITNGFDLAFLENRINEKIKKEFTEDPSFKCVYIGNIGLAQGLQQLLYLAGETLKNKMNVTFFVYGSGVEEGRIRKYAADHHLKNVIFRGKIPNSDIYTVLRMADLSFVPVVNENLKDMIPTKMYEALGVGCPVLLAAEGDAAELLKEAKLGMAVKPNDRAGLWEGFCFLYHNREQVIQNAEHSKAIMRNTYSRQTASVQLVDEITKLIKRN